MFSKIYSEFGSKFIYSVISMGANFLLPLMSLPILTRSLEVESFGKLMIAQAITLILCQIVDFGFMLSGSRKIAIAKDNKSEIREILSTIQTVRLILLIFVLLITLAIAKLDFLPINSTLLLYSALPSALGTFLQATWFFQGSGYFGLLAVANCVSKIIYFMLIYFFVKEANDLYIAATSFGAMYLISSAILCACMSRIGLFYKICLEKEKIYNSLKEGFSNFLSLALLGMHTQLLVPCVGIFINPAMAGILAASDRVVRGFSSIAIPLLNTLFPTFSRLYAEKNPHANYLRKKTIIIMLITSVLGTAVLYTQANIIANLLFPNETTNVANAIKILSIMPIFFSIGVLYGGLTLIPSGLNKEYLFAIGYSEIICLISFIFFYLTNNANAGIFSMILTEISISFLMFIFFRLHKKHELTQ